jgi:hypothetical protein
MQQKIVEMQHRVEERNNPSRCEPCAPITDSKLISFRICLGFLCLEPAG